MISVDYTPTTAEPICLNEAKLHLRVDSTADDEHITALIQAATQFCEAYEGQAYMIRTRKLYLDWFPTCIYVPFYPLISVSSIQYYDSSGSLQTLSSAYYTVDNDHTPGRIYEAYGYAWPTTYDIPKAIIVTYTCGYSTTYTANATTDVLTVGNAVFADADIVRVKVSAEDNAAIQTGLAVRTDYHVRDVSGSTLKLAASAGGAAIDLTSAGTGTFYIGFADKGNVPERVIAAIKLILGHYYEHREEISEMNINQIPLGAKNLLSERVWTPDD